MKACAILVVDGKGCSSLAAIWQSSLSQGENPQAHAETPRTVFLLLMTKRQAYDGVYDIPTLSAAAAILSLLSALHRMSRPANGTYVRRDNLLESRSFESAPPVVDQREVLVKTLPLQKCTCWKKAWLVLVAGLALGASTASAGQTLPPGVWQSRGYGAIFQVDAGGVTLYDTLGPQCLRQSRMTLDQFSGNYGDWTSDGTPPSTAWHLIVSGMTVDRLDHMPPACAKANGVPDRDPLQNFDFLWNTFDTHYAFFAKHGVDWQALRKTYRARVAALPKNGDPFPIFADMLMLLKDTHVRLSDGKRVAHVKKFPPVMQAGPNGPVLLDDHYLQKQLAPYLQGKDTPLMAAARETGNGLIYYGKLKPRSNTNDDSPYGYVAIFGMDCFGKGENEDIPMDTRVRSVNAAMDEVVASLRGVQGVIVDLRYNGGGEESVALAIAGHFTDTPRTVWSKRVYQKGKTYPAYAMQVQPSAGNRLTVPLVVLTSDFTVSAAETATMALRALPGTVQIGQPTRGVLSDRLEKVLPNGWSFSLSNEIYLDPQGKAFEVSGVPPDLPTPAPPPTSPDALRFGRDIDAGAEALHRLAHDGTTRTDSARL